MAELTVRGFVARTLQEIIDEISGNLKDSFGDAFDTSPESPDGQKIGIFAEQIYNAEQAAQAAYQSSDPDLAREVQLEYVCDYNGVYRQLLTHTIVSVTFTGTNGANVPKGTLIATEGGIELSTDIDTVVGSLVSATCIESGAVIVEANSITKIKTPVAGVTGVSNVTEGTTGKDKESDAQLRNRRSFSVVNSGINTVEAIHSSLIKAGAEFVTIVNNTKDVADQGVPAHNYMVIVKGLTDVEVGKAIFSNAPAGVPTAGASSVEVLDSKGVAHTFKFQRPTTKTVYVNITYKPLQGASKDVKEHIGGSVDTFLDGLQIGDDVIWSDVFASGVVGAHQSGSNASVKTCRIGLTENPTGTDDIILLPSEKVLGIVKVTEVS